MQIDEATKQAAAARTEGDERNSSMAVLGAETGTAADEQTKAEGLRQMEAVVERSNLWLAYERVMRNKGAAGVDGLTVSDQTPEVAIQALDRFIQLLKITKK